MQAKQSKQIMHHLLQNGQGRSDIISFPGIPEHILKESGYDDDNDDYDGADEKLYRDTNLKKSDASPITNVGQH